MPSNTPEEYVLYITDQEWCGSGGCTMLVLRKEADTYKVLGETTIVNLPIRQLTTYSHGQPDLTVVVRGGGILQPYQAALHFDGKRYASNPSVAPAQRMNDKVRGTDLITAKTPLLSLSDSTAGE